MQTCPMAQTCKGMIEKPGLSYWMIVTAVVFIVMRVALLMMVKFMRGIGRRFQR